MQHQKYIEMAREIIETATTNESLYGRLKGLAMDFAGDFPASANDSIGRKIWFDGEHSVFLDAGCMGAKITYLDGTFPPDVNEHIFTCFDYPLCSAEDIGQIIQITFGVYTVHQGEWMSSNASILADVESVRKYLEFF